jgi:hypothetical protein
MVFVGIDLRCHREEMKGTIYTWDLLVVPIFRKMLVENNCLSVSGKQLPSE